jgi:hypothetical protein
MLYFVALIVVVVTALVGQHAALQALWNSSQGLKSQAKGVTAWEASRAHEGDLELTLQQAEAACEVMIASSGAEGDRRMQALMDNSDGSGREWRQVAQQLRDAERNMHALVPLCDARADVPLSVATKRSNDRPQRENDASRRARIFAAAVLSELSRNGGLMPVKARDYALLTRSGAGFVGYEQRRMYVPPTAVTTDRRRCAEALKRTIELLGSAQEGALVSTCVRDTGSIVFHVASTSS